jgi:hypothetical protein
VLGETFVAEAHSKVFLAFIVRRQKNELVLVEKNVVCSSSMGTNARRTASWRHRHRRPGGHLVADANEVEQHFFDNLFNNEWELTKSPAGAYQWKAKGAPATIPDAHDKSNKHVPILAILPLRIPPELHRHWLTPL